MRFPHWNPIRYISYSSPVTGDSWCASWDAWEGWGNTKEEARKDLRDNMEATYSRLREVLYGPS